LHVTGGPGDRTLCHPWLPITENRLRPVLLDPSTTTAVVFPRVIGKPAISLTVMITSPYYGQTDLRNPMSHNAPILIDARSRYRSW
jgi:hypothetical protein